MLKKVELLTLIKGCRLVAFLMGFIKLYMEKPLILNFISVIDRRCYKITKLAVLLDRLFRQTGKVAIWSFGKVCLM